MQSGSSLTGTYSSGTLFCQVGTASGSSDFAAGALTGGSVNAAAVRFFIGNIEINGTYNGSNEVSGTASATFTGFGALAGSFRMTR